MAFYRPSRRDFGVRFIGAVPRFGIAWMIAMHGTLIAFGFALPGLLAWVSAKRTDGVES